MLLIHSLKYNYPAGKKLHFRDFTCPQGQNMLLLGRSGSGKTTLLHLLAGILSPAGGEIVYNDHNFSALKAAEKDQYRGSHIGMIFQKHYFIDGISVLENLKASARVGGSHSDSHYLEGILQQLEIAHLAAKKPGQLSEGEQQRFSIARALANKPSWILADEPTSSLDDANCENFVALMKQNYTHKPVSWIIATHDSRLKNHFSSVYQL
jgi:ABC-type lipoprotein export system ATPase subunit